MTKIIWDAVGEREYETGVDRGVLYPMSTATETAGTYPTGTPWNGLTGVTESPEGAESTPLYADNIKYLNMVSAEALKGTIEAYMYPDEFGVCDGSSEPVTGVKVGQQNRAIFGLSYRTLKGNDVDGQSHGYLIHLLYGCLAAPSERAYKTVNDSPEAITFSWEFSTTPVPVTGLKPTASITVDSTKVGATELAALEDALYGTTGTPGTTAYLPLPDAVITLLTPAGG